MTPELETVIKNLNNNILRISSLHKDCLSENVILKEKINSLVEEIKKKEIEKLEIQKKYETLKLAKVIASSSEDSHDAKIKLNRIVREVDRCISLLNK